MKDEVHVEGQRATEGSLLFADQVATGTDPFAQRLIDAGRSSMPARPRRSSRWPR